MAGEAGEEANICLHINLLWSRTGQNALPLLDLLIGDIESGVMALPRQAGFWNIASKERRRVFFRSQEALAALGQGIGFARVPASSGRGPRPPARSSRSPAAVSGWYTAC